MKKRALSCAAACGLLLLGAAAWPQDPVGGDPAMRQAAPPSFRDVLRGKVGQECQAGALHGVWTLWFSAAIEAQPKEAEGEVPEALSYAEAIELVKSHGVELSDSTVIKLRQEALQRVAEGVIQEHLDGNVALVRLTGAVTLVAVGQDFVQLREADGTERYVPLSRVDVVVRPAGK